MTTTTTFQWPLLLCVIGVTGLFAGCGKSPYAKTYPVAGSVFYQGKPVAGATVILIPKSPEVKSAYGETDSTGNFTLNTYMGPSHIPDGAMSGEYWVTITKKEKHETSKTLSSAELMALASKASAKHLLPKNYSEPQTSGLEIVVADKTPPPFTFELKD